MIIRVEKTARDSRIILPDLITRPVGRIFFEAVSKKLDLTSKWETLLLDFEGIKVIDSSFVDESIVRLILLSREEDNPFFVKMKNISQIAEINIDLVFNSYTTYNNIRMVVVTEDIRMNNRFHIGHLEQIESNIIEYLRKNKRASIEELSELTGQSLDSVSETADILYRIRILKKDGIICEAV